MTSPPTACAQCGAPLAPDQRVCSVCRALQPARESFVRGLTIERGDASAGRFVLTLGDVAPGRPFTVTALVREPVPIQTPTETLRTCGICSVTTRTPFGRRVRSISRTLVALTSPFYPAPGRKLPSGGYPIEN